MAKKEKDMESKGGSNKIVVVILALIVLGAGAFGGFYLYLNTTNRSTKSVEEVKVPVGEEMMIKLSDEGGNRYLKANVTISYDKRDKNVGKELTNKAVEVKDKTLFYLMSKKVADFKAENEEKLKTDLINEINKILNDGKIVDVYFGQLLTQ